MQFKARGVVRPCEQFLARLSLLKQKSLEYQGGTLKSLHYRAGAAA